MRHRCAASNPVQPISGSATAFSVLIEDREFASLCTYRKRTSGSHGLASDDSAFGPSRLPPQVSRPAGGKK